ncbi:hypothetical protein CDAR_293221 [Caerostris darwini]|uniref:Uncharacterized protein n=1 Tax=Caerostris darwini TaxID=1538125 RepID=A0AAV4QGP1_9ARAC|nr:hypothetical protein CDAR_293221 [Caerostris darwini]
MLLTLLYANHSQSTGFEPVRGDPNGFRVHRLNHSATTARNSPSNRSRQDSNLRGETPMDFKSIALTTRPRLHENWHGVARDFDSPSNRSRQDSNLRGGETPMDFKSIALTTRPRLHENWHGVAGDFE